MKVRPEIKKPPGSRGLTFFCYLLKQIETGHQVVFIGFPDRDTAAIN